MEKIKDKDFLKEIEEDFDLIEIQEKNNIFKFFHKLIRRKYYRRIKKFKEEKTEKKFKVVKNIEDQYKTYKKNYKNLKIFHEKIDNDLFCLLGKKLREKCCPKEQNFDKNYKEQYNKKLDYLIKEFKIQINELIDFYNRAYLYKLINPENMNVFYDFKIKYENIKDIMLPFLLTRLFNRINHISSKIFNKFFIIFLSKIVKVNISTWALLLPELNLIRIDNFVGRKIENILYSKFFDKQKNQLLFLFSNLNQILHDFIFALKTGFNKLYSAENPLFIDEYLYTLEEINLVFKEINNIKFPKSENQELDVQQICSLTDIDIKKEIKIIKDEQNDMNNENEILSFKIQKLNDSFENIDNELKGDKLNSDFKSNSVFYEVEPLFKDNDEKIITFSISQILEKEQNLQKNSFLNKKNFFIVD